MKVFKLRIGISAIFLGLAFENSALADHPMTRERARVGPDYFRNKFYEEKNAAFEAELSNEKAEGASTADNPENGRDLLDVQDGAGTPVSQN